jgi:hypothetical protein
LIVGCLLFTENKIKGSSMHMIRWSFLFLFCWLHGISAWADREQKLAVGQGISAPMSISTVHYANGFTYSNAAVAASLSKPLLTFQGDTGEDSAGNNQNGFGAEFAIGTGEAGVALWYYDRECKD